MAVTSDDSGVTVVIPCHDEAAAIADVVHRAHAALAGRPHEVLVVDDGSTDATGDAAAAAGARVLRFAVNRGKGVALREAARAAHHGVLVFLDGDGQDDALELPRLLVALDDATDLVIGSRFLGELHPGAIRRLNLVANHGFSLLISALFGQRITDSQAGFRALRRDAFLALPLTAAEYDIETETLLAALKAGWRVREVPVHRYARQGSATGFDRVRHGLLILWTIVRERATPPRR